MGREAFLTELTRDTQKGLRFGSGSIFTHHRLMRGPLHIVLQQNIDALFGWLESS
jgi:hypothetical protein